MNYATYYDPTQDQAYVLGHFLGIALVFVIVVVVTTLIVRAVWRSGSATPAPVASAMPTKTHSNRLQKVIGIGLYLLAAAILVTTLAVAF